MVRDLSQLPKAHVHVHVESTISDSTLAEFASEADAALPAQRSGFTDFSSFAATNGAVRDLLRSPEHFRRIAREFCADQASDGVRYAEMTFTAAAHGERLADPEMPLCALLDGVAIGMREHDIEIAVILDHPRKRSVQRWAQTIQLAEKFAERGVVAIGLAGAEGHPIDRFGELCRQARSAGVALVHHAGETQGASGVRAALDLGLAQRIGHGLSILDDPALVTRMRAEGIGVEVCPSSNTALGVVDHLADHPLPRMVDAGLMVSVNTDIPANTGRTLTDEYRSVQQAFAYDDNDIARFARHAVQMSYASAASKTRLYRDIEHWLG